MKCYAIKDKKMKTFLAFVWVQNIVEVTRSLQVQVNDPNSNLHRFTEDFALYHICDGNIEQGTVTVPVSGPTLELELTEFKNQKGVKNVG